MQNYSKIKYPVGMNKTVIFKWFDSYEDMMNKLDIKELHSHVWNFHKSGFRGHFVPKTAVGKKGGAENAGHENDGPAKYRVVKMQDMKMKDQVARHENAGQEHVGHENATHRQFTRCCYKQ